MALSQGAPRRRRVDRRLPALSSLRGHRPAQERRCAAVANRPMSVPISDRMTWALSSLTPGIVLNCLTASRKQASPASASRSISAIAASSASTCCTCRLIPILRLPTCDCPIAAGDGHDFPRLIHERVPGVAAVIDDVVEGFENPVRQPVLPHELPDIFLAVEFGRAWRELQERDVAWNREGCCSPRTTGHGQGLAGAAVNSRGERYPRALCG